MDLGDIEELTALATQVPGSFAEQLVMYPIEVQLSSLRHLRDALNTIDEHNYQFDPVQRQALMSCVLGIAIPLSATIYELAMALALQEEA